MLAYWPKKIFGGDFFAENVASIACHTHDANLMRQKVLNVRRMAEQNRDDSGFEAPEQLFSVIVTANAVFERQIKFVLRQQLHKILLCVIVTARKVFVVNAAAEAVNFNSSVHDGLHNLLPLVGAFAVVCHPSSMNVLVALLEW